MKRTYRYFPLMLVVSVLALGACDDNGANEDASARDETAVIAPAVNPETTAQSTMPSAEGTLPDATGGEQVADLEEGVIAPDATAAESSMAEGSPGGTAVTEQELPQSDVPPPSREVFTDAECDFEGWIGKPVDEAAAKETGRIYRVLEPGAVMTMDHNPQRINVEHDDSGTVTRVWCG